MRNKRKSNHTLATIPEYAIILAAVISRSHEQLSQLLFEKYDCLPLTSSISKYFKLRNTNFKTIKVIQTDAMNQGKQTIETLFIDDRIAHMFSDYTSNIPFIKSNRIANDKVFIISAIILCSNKKDVAKLVKSKSDVDSKLLKYWETNYITIRQVGLDFLTLHNKLFPTIEANLNSNQSKNAIMQNGSSSQRACAKNINYVKLNSHFWEDKSEINEDSIVSSSAKKTKFNAPFNFSAQNVDISKSNQAMNDVEMELNLINEGTDYSDDDLIECGSIGTDIMDLNLPVSKCNKFFYTNVSMSSFFSVNAVPTMNSSYCSSRSIDHVSKDKTSDEHNANSSSF